MQSRPARLADQVRMSSPSSSRARCTIPGIGFLTLTRATVTPDLQIARVYYTSLGDEKAAQRETGRALHRAAPFLRRQLGRRLRLRRVPELEFFYDASIAHARPDRAGPARAGGGARGPRRTGRGRPYT